MNILITGGVGFIGTNCALKFAKNKKNSLFLIDNFSRLGVKKNVDILSKNQNIKIIKAAVGDLNKYSSEIKKADVIIHLAGQTAVTSSIVKPHHDFKNNLVESFILLDYIRRNSPKTTIIYSSTNKVYGNLANHQIIKNIKNKRYVDICHPNGLSENEQLNFISPYGCSKGAVDQYFLDYGRVYGLHTVVFRQSCIYGRWQIGVEDQGWVAHFAKQFLLRQPLTIYGSGLQVRDLLDVDDLITAYSLSIKNINKIKGLVFNIGGGPTNSCSLLQVIEILKKSTGHKIPIKFEPERLGDQKIFISSNEKIKKTLGWQPKTEFKKGLNYLIGWQKSNLTIQ